MSVRLLIIGRGQTAERLCELGGALGYREIRLVDALPPDVGAADHVVIAEEDERRAEELLIAAVGREPAPAYLGLAAPREIGARALVRLYREELPAARVQAVRAPAGVDVGAVEPAEIAVAVAAELVAVRRGRGARIDEAGVPAARRPGVGN